MNKICRRPPVCLLTQTFAGTYMTTVYRAEEVLAATPGENVAFLPLTVVVEMVRYAPYDITT